MYCIFQGMVGETIENCKTGPRASLRMGASDSSNPVLLTTTPQGGLIDTEYGGSFLQ